MTDVICLLQSLHNYALGLLISTRLSKGTIETRKLFFHTPTQVTMSFSVSSFVHTKLSAQATGPIHVYDAQQLHVEALYLAVYITPTLQAIIGPRNS